MTPLTHSPMDTALLLGCAALVMLMQAGFCCIESGLVRSKNSVNVAFKNVIDFCISSLVFWLFGYALIFGVSRYGLFGTTGFLFGQDTGHWELSFFLFQMVFCGTATTIISGAIAERMRLSAYIVITVLVSGFLYPLFGHWAWGGVTHSLQSGWLAELGFIDYAGATVVHSTGGWVALAAILVIGPRLGRFTHQIPIYGHNLPLTSVGVLLLWFGWFGFNGGSMFMVSDKIPMILINTSLAAAAGGITAVLVSWRLTGQPRVENMLNGVIAGLVGITAGCHVMTTTSAVVVGAIAGIVCLVAMLALEKMKIDDAIGAVPAHAFAGAWGTLAVALLGDPAGWPSGLGRLDQFMVQAIGVGTCFLWSFGVGWIILRLVNHLHPMRIDAQSEEVGLNVAEHGARSPISDLVEDMTRHREDGDFSQPVTVEPHTEVGQIAQEYNRVLEKVTSEIVAQEEASKALLAINQDLQMLRTVATAANKATSPEDAFSVILEEVCAYTGWPVGHVYVPAEGIPDQLKPTGLWYLKHPLQFQTFKEVTEATSFDIGIGLPGRVMASRKPAWIIDVTKDTNFPRAKLAKDIGVKAGFAFPVLVGSEVVAVLEFFSSEALPPNEGMLEVMADIGTQLGRVLERQRAREELVRMAEHDKLTGLGNRDLFSRRLDQTLTRAREDPQFAFAVMFLDLDRFKVVNDSLGHEVGDHLLISVAERIEAVLARERSAQPNQPRHTAARLGGDEFVVLLQDIKQDEAEDIAQQIQLAITIPHTVAGREVIMSASIGIVTSKDGYENTEEVLRDADLAMYEAKAAGRSQHIQFDKQMHEGVVERLNLETDLRKAMAQKQFKLQYQPIVCLESNRLLGFEALLRWMHPQRGLISPDRFIPLAEETGLIVPIGAWVMATAIRQLKQWHDRYPDQKAIRMNVNLSKNQLVQPEFVEQTQALISTIGVDPRTVTFEITESMIMDNTQVVIPVLHRLRDLGSKLAMDDFGTGHSSLSNLYSFPIDVLKIDRAFIWAMDENRGYQAVVHAIVTLAHNLNMAVVAEGIETTEQIAVLQALEADRGQGYIFAKPLDAADAEQRVANPTTLNV